jgi:AraC-like DNA-binding protein
MSERQYLDRAASKPRVVPWHLGSNHSAARLLARAVTGESFAEGLASRSILLQVVAWCFDWKVNNKHVVDGTVLPASKRIQLLMEEMTEMELCEVSPADLATQCGCSVQHFNRLFQSQFGVPFRTRQNELRLLKARELLVESGASVQVVARKVGCQHVSYFNSQFKKEFGLTPSEFRRQLSKAQNVSDKGCMGSV